MKTKITEEMNIQEEWYKEARSMTLDKLPDFINKLVKDYSHDYGTICHALSAGGIATMCAMDGSEQGGITGFQAGAIMWQFIRNWSYSHNKTGLKMVDYDNFLFPQYGYKFDKTIEKDTWESIRKEAESKIKEVEEKHERYLKELEQYKIDIAEFIGKYPDFHENAEYYNHLSCGTGAEWEKEEEKKNSGFEFAPQKPYDPSPDKRVIQHWKSIVDGKVPFGYRVVEED